MVIIYIYIYPILLLLSWLMLLLFKKMVGGGINHLEKIFYIYSWNDYSQHMEKHVPNHQQEIYIYTHVCHASNVTSSSPYLANENIRVCMTPSMHTRVFTAAAWCWISPIDDDIARLRIARLRISRLRGEHRL